MLDRACDLGLSFELVNMARNMWHDNAAERAYLPLEWLAEADIPPGEHMRPAYREQLVALVARLLDLADEHAAAARHGAAQLPFRRRWAALTAARSTARSRARCARRARRRGTTACAVPRRRGCVRSRGPSPRRCASPASRRPAPRWTRGELVIAARMVAPIPPMPMTPLPDEEIT